MTANTTDRECKLTCRSFYCSKRMLKIVNKNGKKVFLCQMDSGECLGYMCNYAECRERKMSDTGQCLRPVKPQQKEIPTQQKKVQYSDYDYMTPNELDAKLRKKIAKKF